MFLTYEVVT